jgi:hypothetical protein
MPRRPSEGLLFLVVLLAGCAAQPPIQLPAVGPAGAAAKLPPAQDEEDAMKGTLIVYSEALPVSQHRSAPSYPHTGYVIFRANGQVLAKIDNNTASVESRPEEVPLPAGLYQVRARGAQVGTVLVPVVIAPRKSTVLYLDAEGMPEAEARTLTDPVTLADGRVVGARAAPAH